jgi:peroxiredoxin
MIGIAVKPVDMVSEGDEAPTFTAPLANGDVETFDLSEALEDGPIVLAFFPGAFTSVCSHEMNTFQDRLGAMQETGATLYGVSVDSPFTLNEFRDKLGLEFDLISDANHDVIELYDIVTSFDQFGIEELAQRAVVVIDESGTVTYAWVGENAGLEPDYDEVEEAAAAA